MLAAAFVRLGCRLQELVGGLLAYENDDEILLKIDLNGNARPVRKPKAQEMGLGDSIPRTLLGSCAERQHLKRLDGTLLMRSVLGDVETASTAVQSNCRSVPLVITVERSEKLCPERQLSVRAKAVQ